MDALSCTKCSYKFDRSGKCPRMLNCGHTFCESCLARLIRDNDRKCPNCRAGFAYPKADSVPVNYIVKGLISPAEKTITYTNTRQVLTDLIKSGMYYAEEEYGGVKRYGKLTYKEGCVWVNSFKLEKPAAACIPFEDIINKFGVSNGRITTKGFLKLTVCLEMDADDFYIVILTDGESPRAKNFISLCSGLKGSSYKRMILQDCYSPRHYGMCDGPPPVENSIGLRNRDRETRMKTGDVFGMTEKECGFAILMEDCQWNLGPKFGEVISGLQEIGGDYCEITECGLVF